MTNFAQHPFATRVLRASATLTLIVLAARRMEVRYRICSTRKAQKRRSASGGFFVTETQLGYAKRQ